MALIGEELVTGQVIGTKEQVGNISQREQDIAARIMRLADIAEKAGSLVVGKVSYTVEEFTKSHNTSIYRANARVEVDKESLNSGGPKVARLITSSIHLSNHSGEHNRPQWIEVDRTIVEATDTPVSGLVFSDAQVATLNEIQKHRLLDNVDKTLTLVEQASQ